MSILELIEEIRAGKRRRAAVEKLYAVVRKTVLGRLDRKIPLSLRSRLDAEDVLHTAFIKALAHLGDFRGESEQAFVAWVYRIAKNHLLDLADRKSVCAVPFVAPEEGEGPRLSQVKDPETQMTTRLSRREQIDVLLARLTPREAEVIRLRQLDGQSFEEIAAAWSSTPGAVQRFFSRSWAKLSALAKKGEA